MYKIGYIKGYDKFNTLDFANENEQKAFFDSKVNVTIDAYYPPHYTNVISLDSTQFDVNRPNNFVIIVSNSKYYYYLINRINYINEDLYDIEIIMDTIQTYMFNITINNAIQTKDSIKRWIGSDINRNYIRENVSKGDFQNYVFNYLDTRKFLVIWSSLNSYVSHPNDLKNTDIVNNNLFYPTGLYCYILPLLTDDELQHIQATRRVHIHYYTIKGGSIVDDTFSITDLTPKNFIKSVISDNGTVSMYITSSYNLDRMFTINKYTDDVGNFIDINIADDINIDNTNYNIVFNNTNYIGFPISTYYSSYINYLNSLPTRLPNNEFISKNTILSRTFNYKYVPQILDENYLQIEFGERLGGAGTKLYECKSPEFYYSTAFDLMSGSRAYRLKYISDDKFDRYKMLINVTSADSFNLINDAWKTYESTHKGSLTTGIALKATNIIYNTVKGITGAGASTAGYSAMGSVSNTDIGQMAGTVGVAKGKMGMMTSIADFAWNMANMRADYQINKENLEGTPDTVGQGTLLYADITNKSFEPFYSYSAVSDIENCAKILEYYGYTVHNNILNTAFSNLIKNRYYYNVYKFDNIQISFNMFVSAELENDIMNRLKLGVRLFKANQVISDDITEVLKYDNLESELV